MHKEEISGVRFVRYKDERAVYYVSFEEAQKRDLEIGNVLSARPGWGTCAASLHRDTKPYLGRAAPDGDNVNPVPCTYVRNLLPPMKCRTFILHSRVGRPKVQGEVLRTYEHQ